MKVNIAGVWYDSEKQPIQIKLSESDKRNIQKMQQPFSNYISCPQGTSWEEVKQNLKIDDEANPIE